jgi:PBS lyase HEAT-like repeat
MGQRGCTQLMAGSVAQVAQLEQDEAGIERLVKGLFSLTDGELSVAALVGIGEPAIPALRRVLLQGAPSTVYLPRQRVVRVLGELGAFYVLSEYLLREKDIRDPELRLAEEAVENAAARELGRCQSDRAFYVLRDLVATRKLPGAVEALAHFRREEAAPALVAALESDFCRSAAADGIRPIRAAAVPYLIFSVRSPEPSRAEESPSSLRRRRAALRLLAEEEVDGSRWPSLEFLLNESDEWLQSSAAQIAFRLKGSESALRILLRHLTSTDWVLVDDIAQFLRQHLSAARELLVQESNAASASATPEEEKRCRLVRWILKPETGATD